MALLSGIPEQVSYLVGMPFQVSRGAPSAVSFDPWEVMIVALYVVGLVLMLLGARPLVARPRPGTAVWLNA